MKINQVYWNILIEQESVEEVVGKKSVLHDQRGKEMQNQANKSGQTRERRSAEVYPEVIHEIMQLEIIKPLCSSRNVSNKTDKPRFWRPYRTVYEATDSQVAAVLHRAHDADTGLGARNCIF